MGTGVPAIGAGALGIGPKRRPLAWYSAQSATGQRHAAGRAGRSQEHRRAGPVAAGERGKHRAGHRHRDRDHPAPGPARDDRRGPVPGRAAAQAAGRRAQRRHGGTAGAGPAAGRGPGSVHQPGGGADRRAVHRRDRPGRPRVRPGPLGGGAAGQQRGQSAEQLQRDVRQPVPAQPVADRAPGAHDRLPRAERGRPRAAVQPVRDGPPGHPYAPQLGEPAPAGRARGRAQVERAGVAGGRGPGRGVGDRAVQPGDAEDPAGHRGHRAGRLRRRAPAGRGDRERHDLLRQGHPGARGRARN